MHVGVWMQNPDARILRFLRSQRFVRFPALSTFITFSRGRCKKAGGCQTRMHVFYTFSTYRTFSTHRTLFSDPRATLHCTSVVTVTVYTPW